jgi:hypothetical protein
MFRVFREKPQILIEAQKAKFRPGFGIQVLIFLAIYLVTSIAQSIPIVAITFFQTVTAAMRQDVALDDPEQVMEFAMSLQYDSTLLMLFLTVLATVIVIIYCRFIEKRSLYSMGFNRKNAVGQYFTGLLVGFVMISTSLAISWASGSMKFNGFSSGSNIGLLLCFLSGFVLQGMSEEVILRGYFMVSVAAKNSILLAVISNSIIFSVLHLLNPGISVIGILNLLLFGVFASVYTLKMNSIWGICAIHSIWNYAQGNLFGIKVSGMDTGVSVLSFLPTGSSTLINGGAFGLEGGLAVTIVLVLSTLITFMLPGKEIAKADEAMQPPPLSPAM